MSRPLRITFPGAIYHLTSRGNAQAAIYADDADRRAFLDLLTQIVQRYHWLCLACLALLVSTCPSMASSVGIIGNLSSCTRMIIVCTCTVCMPRPPFMPAPCMPLC